MRSAKRITGSVIFAIVLTVLFSFALAACTNQYNKKDDIPGINNNAVIVIDKTELSFALGMKFSESEENDIIARCGCVLTDDEGHEVTITKAMLDEKLIKHDRFDLSTVGRNKRITVSYKDRQNYIFYNVSEYNVTFYTDSQKHDVYKTVKAQAQLNSDLNLAVWVDTTAYNYSTDSDVRRNDEYGASHFKGWFTSDGSPATGLKSMPVSTATVVNYELHADYLTEAEYSDLQLSYDNRDRRVFSGYLGDDGIAVVPEGVTYINLAAICSNTPLNIIELRVPSTATLDVPISGDVNTSGLQQITVDPGNAYYSSYNGSLYNKDYQILYLLPASNLNGIFHENLRVIGPYACAYWEGNALTIPDSVTEIRDYGFYNSLIKDLIIDSEVKQGVGAFLGTNIPSMNIVHNGVASYTRFEDDGKTTYRLDRIIDKNITGYKLMDDTVEIAQEVFSGCENLESIDLGNTLVKINEAAFIGCTSLKSVKFPASVTEFGRDIFEKCSSLETVDMSDLKKMNYVAATGTDNNTLPSGMFQDCSALKSVELPEFIENIGNNAFNGCINLTGINVSELPLLTIGTGAFHSMGAATDGFTMTLPASVQSIGNQAFSHSQITSINFDELTELTDEGFGTNVFEYSHIRSITFPSQITVVPEKTFYYAPSLVSVGMNNAVSIGTQAFSYSAIENIDFGQMEKIPDRAFAFCNSLVSVTLPDSVVWVEQYAFRNCAKLETFTLGKNTKIFGTYNFLEDGVTFGTVVHVFFNTSSLKEVNVPEENEYFTSENGILFARYIGTKFDEEGNLVNGTDFGDKKAVLMVLPASNGLTEYTLPAETVATAPYSVEAHKTLKTIDLAEGLKNIGKATFYNSKALERVDIPSTVTNIGASIFLGCSAISHVAVAAGNPVYNSPDGIIVYDADNGIVLCVPKTAAEIVIQDGTKKINDALFMDNTVITKITIPNSVTEIGSKVFSGCTALETLEIGSGVTSIGSDTFANLKSLKTIKVDPANEYFKTDSTNTILYSKDGKKLLLYAAKSEHVITDTDEVLIGVEEIGEYAFAYNEGLVTVKLPLGVKIIGNYAFYGCTDLATFYGSPDLEKIGNYAFALEALPGLEPNDMRYGDKLKTVLLYDKVQGRNFGDHAFYGQYGIENAYFVMSDTEYVQFVNGLRDAGVKNYVHLTSGCRQPDGSYANNNGNGVKICIYRESKPVAPDVTYDWFYFESDSTEPVKWTYEQDEESNDKNSISIN